MKHIQEILLERESNRHQDRQNRINALLTDGNKCFEAEVNLVEKMHQQQVLREEEGHRLRINQINADADELREAVTQRYLSELEGGIDSVELILDLPVSSGDGEVSDLLKSIPGAKEVA